MKPWRVGVGWLAAARLCWGVAASAQSAVVTGTVAADSTRRPLPLAELQLDEAARTRADGQGRFRLAEVAAGRHRLTARTVGFRPLTVEIAVEPGDTLEVDLLLTPVAVELAPLEVTGAAAAPVSAKLAGFETRRQAGFGRFLTRAELARYDHGPLTTALRVIAGVRLVPMPCSGGYAAGTTRGGDTGRNTNIFCSGIRGRYPLPPACYFTVWLDGTRIWSGGPEPPPDIDQIQAQALEAVEVYRGPAELPSQYQGSNSACGALLLWTRTGES